MKGLSYITGGVLLVFAVLLFFNLPVAGVISAAGGIVVLIVTARSSRAKPSPRSSAPVPPAPEISPPVEEETISEAEAADGVKIWTFLAVGMYYRLKDFNRLGTRNPLYDLPRLELKKQTLVNQRIYEYSYRCGVVTFEDEPTNEFDPDAIRVIIDGIHVAYIKKGSTSRLRSILKKNVLSVTATAGGGNYKIVHEANNFRSVEQGDAKHWLRIIVKYKEV